MTGILGIGFTVLFMALFYGMAHWEANVLQENCRPIPESRLHLQAFLETPEAIKDELPPRIDHAVKGQPPGIAPEAICLYARWLHPSHSQMYSIWSNNREVLYRCL